MDQAAQRQAITSPISDMSRPAGLQLPRGRLHYPVFMPDATQGVVRAVDATDAERCQVQALVMNTFHLMQRPGTSTIQALGGLHEMSGWHGPIVTDSGGFQAYSLIHQNARFGTIDDEGINFKPEGAERKFHLSPEKTVQLQMSYGADIVICLDDCTNVVDDMHVQELSVRRTIAWARRCKREFERLVEQKRLPPEQRPLLFAVIQGGGSRELRKRCAEELLALGFDGFGFGGWPLDQQNKLLTEIIAYTRELIPTQFPMHALGIGHPYNIVECLRLGYDLFDSALPTRDARHGRLYTFTDDPATREDWTTGENGSWLSFLYIGDDKYIKAKRPVSSYCDCLCCTHYTLGYLHHLFKINDTLFYRLATIHNLRFMTQLTQRLRDVYYGPER